MSTDWSREPRGRFFNGLLAHFKDALVPELGLDALEGVAEKLPELVATGWHETYGVERLMERLDADPAAPDTRLIALEMRFLGLSRHMTSTARLARALGDNPELFVIAVTAAYRAEGDPPRTLSDSEARAANGANELLQRWKGYPGIDAPAEQREDRLLKWSTDILTELEARRRDVPGAIKVGDVLARVPAGNDGIWPCRAARSLLASARWPKLVDGLFVGKRNLRGVTTKMIGEGGPQERELARDCADKAARLAESSPATADLLRRLADAYLREAQTSDEAAEADRAEYDLGPAQPGPRVGHEPEAPAEAPHDDVLHVMRVRGLRSLDEIALPLSALTVVVGATACGKSAIAEALALLRRAPAPQFLSEVKELFGGVGAILRAGARELEVGVTLGSSASRLPELAYALTLVRDPDGGARILRDRLTDVHSGNERVLADGRFSGHSNAEESEEVRGAFDRIRRALRGIEVHVGFDVTSSWASRSAARMGGARHATPPDPGDRVHLFGAGLAPAYATLRARPAWSAEILPDVQRVLGDVSDVRVRPEANTGNPALTVVRGGRVAPVDELSASELAWLSLVAVLALADGARTLLVLDDPAPTVPVAHVAAVLEKHARRVPILYLTANEGIIGSLSNAEQDVRVCRRGADGRVTLESYVRPER